jgi:serine/threonine-protein kinase
MPLQPGDKLGPYEILVPIGAGGMGEVYRARDARLNRYVAIKVSQERFSDRFEREARAVGALNHPNICTLYDVGPNYLVMELIEGESPKGPLPLEETLCIMRQIADALDAAHEKGIVHRDLKPGNIKIKPDGTVKVLDFGLAKTVEAPAGDPESSPTMTISPTRAGMILGTAAYMSPEQARGKTVDKRADIWAFGVVFYELVTGRRPFKGEDLTETLASVMKDTPDLTAIPAQVQRLLQQCLEKDPKKRLRDIGDAWALLKDSPVARAGGARPWIVIACIAVSVSFVAAVGWLRATRPTEKPLVRFEVDLGTDLTPDRRAAISPDGTRIAFAAIDADGKGYLLTRSLDQTKASVLDQGVIQSPFFSPDSKWIGYLAGDKLKKISVEGGLPATITSGAATGGGPRGGPLSSWGENGEMVSPVTYGGLSRVPSSGGAAQPIPGSRGSSYGVLLPGEADILLSGGTSSDAPAPPLSILALRSGKANPILQLRGFMAQYLRIGYILYLDDRAVLCAVPFDTRRMASTGPTVPLLEDVTSFDISAAGTVLCRRGRPTNLSLTVQWVDESGTAEPILTTPAAYASPVLSPDGKRLAVTISDEKGSSLWIHDLRTKAMNRITPGDSATYPVWIPTGRHLLFRGPDGIYLVPADGGGKPRRILDSDGYPRSVSPDGRTLAITRQGVDTLRDIWLVPLEGEGDRLEAGKPEPFVNSPADESAPAFSPDGKWLAYISNQAGRLEVYVRSTMHQGATWLLSAGYMPTWSPNSRKIFFLVGAGDGRGRKLQVASYSVNGDTFVPGAVRPFAGGLRIPVPGDRTTFSVSSQANRIAALQPAKEPENARPRPDYILLLNFFDEIKRRAAQTAAQ